MRTFVCATYISLAFLLASLFGQAQPQAVYPVMFAPAGAVLVPVSTGSGEFYVQTAPTYYAETPAGLVDGNNSTFTLTHMPVPASLVLTVRGMVMKLNVDFTVTQAAGATGATVKFSPAATPDSGSVLGAQYVSGYGLPQ